MRRYVDLSFDPSIRRSVDPSMVRSVDSSIRQAVDQSVDPSSIQSVDMSISRCVDRRVTTIDVLDRQSSECDDSVTESMLDADDTVDS